MSCCYALAGPLTEDDTLTGYGQEETWWSRAEKGGGAHSGEHRAREVERTQEREQREEHKEEEQTQFHKTEDGGEDEDVNVEEWT